MVCCLRSLMWLSRSQKRVFKNWKGCNFLCVIVEDIVLCVKLSASQVDIRVNCEWVCMRSKFVCFFVGFLSVSHSRSLYIKPQSESGVCECVCVCVCHPYPQEGQPRTASRFYFNFRFSSFRDMSISYKTLKALWFCRLFSLQRESHLQRHTVGLAFGHVGMQWKPPAGAVISRVALTKHARPPFSRPHRKTTTAPSLWGSQTIYFSLFFFCKLKLFVLIS